MFCHLFKLFERTTIPLHEFESCDKSCKYYKDEKCDVCIVKNESLTNNKFGWLIDCLVYFKVPAESKSKNTRYVSALSIIHPAEQDIWIIYSLKYSKKDDDWTPVYKYYQSGDIKEFDSLMACNTYLRKIGFVGRKLLDSDFIVKEK